MGDRPIAPRSIAPRSEAPRGQMPPTHAQKCFRGVRRKTVQNQCQKAINVYVIVFQQKRDSSPKLDNVRYSGSKQANAMSECVHIRSTAAAGTAATCAAAFLVCMYPFSSNFFPPDTLSTNSVADFVKLYGHDRPRLVFYTFHRHQRG